MSRPLFTVKGGSFEATKPSREISDWINEWLVPVVPVEPIPIAECWDRRNCCIHSEPEWKVTDDE